MSEKQTRKAYEEELQKAIISTVKLNDEDQSIEVNNARLAQIIQENSSVINMIAWALKLADNYNDKEKAVLTHSITKLGISWKLEAEYCKTN